MNFKLARENMVKQQILTSGFSLDGVAKIMAEIPREVFLPKEIQNLAYCDRNLFIGDKELKSPVFTAKLIDSLSIKTSDNVLKLGLESAYTVALISKLCKYVEVIEYDDKEIELAKEHLKNINISNFEINNAEQIINIKKNKKKYNCIYIANFVEENEIDDSLLELLEEGGRLVFVVRDDISDKAYLITKKPNNVYEKIFLFNTYNK
ncbi:MAG: protein-L-isoaspartate O-methyltransferase [Francisella sp.]